MVRIPPGLRDRLNAIAEAEEKSLSEVIRELIRNAPHPTEKRKSTAA